MTDKEKREQLRQDAVRLAQYGLVIAGILLFLESLVGVIYTLGSGFSTWRAVLADLSVTMAFPIYLLGIASLRTASAALWLFFVAQWINMGFDSWHSGFRLVNPLYWPNGFMLFFAVLLVSYSTWRLSRGQSGKECPTLLNANRL